MSQPSESSPKSNTAIKRQDLREKILSYAELPDNLDGYNGHAPSKQDIDNALSFMSHIPDAGILLVEPMAAGDGDVGYKWYEGPDIEIGFTDGEISFYGCMPNGEILLGDEVFTGAPPENLQKVFAAVFPE